MPAFSFHDYLVPIASDQAVSEGWTPATGNRPIGVPWHWTATADLATCRAALGGSHALRKGVASAHYAVGRSYKEGVDRYVSIHNRSWHAGKGQTVMGDGKALADATNLKATRTYIGVETVNIGYAREGVSAGADWNTVATPDQRQALRVQPWTTEQVAMMIAVGKEILVWWPQIQPRHHHGHVDLCPGYKLDPLGLPFAEILRGIYNDPFIPDVWTPFLTVIARQRALVQLGYLGSSGADGLWGAKSDAALKKFQTDHRLLSNGCWSTAVAWSFYDAFKARGQAMPSSTSLPSPISFGLEDEDPPTEQESKVATYDSSKDQESVCNQEECA